MTSVTTSELTNDLSQIGQSKSTMVSSLPSKLYSSSDICGAKGLRRVRNVSITFLSNFVILINDLPKS